MGPISCNFGRMLQPGTTPVLMLAGSDCLSLSRPWQTSSHLPIHTAAQTCWHPHQHALHAASACIMAPTCQLSSSSTSEALWLNMSASGTIASPAATHIRPTDSCCTELACTQDIPFLHNVLKSFQGVVHHQQSRCCKEFDMAHIQDCRQPIPVTNRRCSILVQQDRQQEHFMAKQ